LTPNLRPKVLASRKRRYGTWPHHVMDRQTICATMSLDESLSRQSYPHLAFFQSPSLLHGGQQGPQDVQFQYDTASTPMGLLQVRSGRARRAHTLKTHDANNLKEKNGTYLAAVQTSLQSYKATTPQHCWRAVQNGKEDCMPRHDAFTFCGRDW
jgi:hypothetical protein